MAPLTKTTAYSYIRFSSAAQERGDSLRRQTQGTEAYVQKKGYTLDTTLHLQDLGVSAFRGVNVREGALAAFLEAVKQGRVKPGSVLIVESLDRLTRDQLLRSPGLVHGHSACRGSYRHTNSRTGV